MVRRWIEGLEGKGHAILMDNFFKSVELFEILEEMGLYATCTFKSSRIGLLRVIALTKAFAKNPTRTLDWRMHSSMKT